MPNSADLANLEHAIDVGAYDLAHRVLDSTGDRRDPRVTYLLGRCAFDRGDLTLAESLWREALSEPRLAPDLHLWLARLYARNGLIDRAESSLAEAANHVLPVVWQLVGTLMVRLSLGDPASIDPKTINRIREDTAAETGYQIVALCQLAANLRAMSNTQPELANKLARSRPWDQLSFQMINNWIVPHAREGGEPRPLFDPAVQTAREVKELDRFAATMDVRCPVLVYGPGTGSVISEICKVKTQHQPPKRIGLWVVVPDLAVLAGALMRNDWHENITRRQIRFFTTDLTELHTHLEEDPRRVPLNMQLPACDLVGDEQSQQYLNGLATMLADIGARAAALKENLRHYYDSNEFQNRWKDSPVGPKRIMIQSCRYTTFVGHSLKHCMQALESNNHEVSLLEEAEEPHSWVGPYYVLDQISRVRPDLLLRVNWLRKAEHYYYPDEAPYLTLVQDYCPEHYASRLHLGRRDFMVAQSKYSLLLQGAEPEQVLGSVVPSLASVYAAPETTRRTYKYDVSYVSHHSRSPEQWRDFEMSRQSDRWHKEWLAEVCEIFRDEYSQGQLPPLSRWWARLALALTKHGPRTDADRQWANEIAWACNNMMLRQSVLHWLSDAGVDLHLFGNGWEHHPRLSKHARGPVANGVPLRELYRSTRINLQLIGMGNMHQRLIDGLMAGGFFLLPKIDIDPLLTSLPSSESQAALAEAIFSNGITTPRELRELRPDLIDAISEIKVAEGHSPNEWKILGGDLPCYRFEHALLTNVNHLFPMLGEFSYGNSSELLVLINRWLGDDPGREKISSEIKASRQLHYLSYEFVMRRATDWIGKRIGSEL